MNPANYRLSKEVLQEMIDDDYRKKFHKFESAYDINIHGVSPADESQQIIDDLFTRLSEPLKKLYAEYLTTANKNCYKEKHISDSFTNLEQISLCKDLERQKLFGNFDRMVANHRDGARFKY